MISTANGKTILEATIYLPRAGVWHADLVVDTQNAADITGAVAVSVMDGQLVLQGSSLRASVVQGPSVWMGLSRARIAGGKAGLGTRIPPQGYQSAPARVILGDILALAGETLSPTSSTSMLGTVLGSWSRMGQDDGLVSAGTAIQALANELGAAWRVLADGTVWIGAETWPTSPLTDYHVLRKSTVDGRIEVGMSAPTLLPGTTFAGGQVGRVTYRVTANAIRAEVFYE